MLNSLRLYAQRHGRLVPRWVKVVGRYLAERAAAFHGVVDTWSAPLVARDHALTPAEMPVAGSVNASHWRGLPAPHAQRAAEFSRLRCVIVTPVLDAGGIDEFVAFLARHLPSRGVDTTILCASPSRKAPANIGILAAVLREEGVCVVEASPNDGLPWLSRNRPDTISAHDPPDWIIEAASTLGIPVVETLHAVPTPIGTDWRQETARSRHITAFVAVSDLVRRQYLRGNPGFAENAVITIPNAFNATTRAPVDRAKARDWLGLEHEFLFVSLARHVLQKNAYGLVAAFADVIRQCPDAHLVIAGRVDDLLYTDEVRRLRDRLSARGRIHLRGNLANPSALLAAADGFVLNSFFEGWPLASMEALAAGLPVVISEVGGAHEQVGCDGTRGYVVPNPLGDAEHVSWEAAGQARFRTQANKAALASAMARVIGDREKWAALRAHLAAESPQRFSVQACAEQHAAILKRAVDGDWATQPATPRE